MKNLNKYLDLSYNDIIKLEGDEKDIASSYWREIQLGVYAPLRDELEKRGYEFNNNNNSIFNTTAVLGEAIYNKTTIREILNQLFSACEEAGIFKDERDTIINNLQEKNERRRK